MIENLIKPGINLTDGSFSVFIVRKLFFSFTTAVLLWSLYLVLHPLLLGTEERKLNKAVDLTSGDDKLPKVIGVQNESVLKVDNTVLTDDDILSQIKIKHPNVFVAHLRDSGPRFNKTCGLYVNPLDIHYNNIYWQQQKTDNESYILYGAYFDGRPAAGGRIIRILAMIDKINLTENANCLLWFGNEKPAFSKISHSLYIWNTKWGAKNESLHPYVLSCSIPKEYGDRVPDSVTLVGRPCDRATNNLRVVHNPLQEEYKKDFVVCVKALNLKHNASFAIRLVEWIELLRILGADKIVFYELHVHENITRVLEHYEKTWNVEIIKVTMPGHYANIPDLMPTYLKHRGASKRLQELIYFTDCLYQNMYQYQYVVLLDVDEVIVPRGEIKTWQQLIYDITLPEAVAAKNITYASFIARNVYFMDDKKELNDWYLEIPKYMHMLQHVRRDRNYIKPGGGIKAFHNTDLILALHNHFARACIGNPNLSCPRYDFDLKDAHLQHYCTARKNPGCTSPRNLTLDTNVWRFKHELIDAVKATLKETGFLKKSNLTL
ncbi:uncharacterized protein LOC135944468 isoform X2 [Cloeon dipterum]|uniref:uncharacterized protein LOC135944468 isoform X2 n=1 Tax=Cloeon dipterum TaxID=197152 RepID=UPI00321FE629